MEAPCIGFRSYLGLLKEARRLPNGTRLPKLGKPGALPTGPSSGRSNTGPSAAKFNFHIALTGISEQPSTHGWGFCAPSIASGGHLRKVGREAWRASVGGSGLAKLFSFASPPRRTPLVPLGDPLIANQQRRRLPDHRDGPNAA